MQEIPKELIVRASGGDIAAFEEIYRAASGFVYNVALRVANNRDDADEITQDVFMRVYKNLRSFGFRSSLKTWIYRIAVNTAINHAKTARRRVSAAVEYDPAVHDAEAPDESARARDIEDAGSEVGRMLARLDADQRACIVLRELEGLDYRSISDILKININTVRSRLKRAREKLIAAGRKG
jgi:RNA polymerase sigma-70 factor (ECF subfamily)